MPRTAPAATPKKAYARAGVDIDLGNRLKGGLQRRLASTHGPEVLGKAGGFGGLFRANFKGMREPVLVSSIDGVGTKLKLAVALDRHDTIGQDLVNHCVNDIAVLGARPLFFLDYLGTGKLEPPVFAQILAGLATACKAAGCALVGGETAQMPGIYHDRGLRSRRVHRRRRGPQGDHRRPPHPPRRRRARPARHRPAHQRLFARARHPLQPDGPRAGRPRARAAADARRGTSARASQLPPGDGKTARPACSRARRTSPAAA